MIDGDSFLIVEKCQVDILQRYVYWFLRNKLPSTFLLEEKKKKKKSYKIVFPLFDLYVVVSFLAFVFT